MGMVSFSEKVFTKGWLSPSVQPWSFLNNVGGALTIHSGVMPDPSIFPFVNTSYTAYNTAYPPLVKWKPLSGTLAATGSGSMVITTASTTALLSGTATWFTLYYEATTINLVIIGNIGPRGSGADMMIGNPDIVAGQTYKVTGFEIKFPTTGILTY